MVVNLPLSTTFVDELMIIVDNALDKWKSST